jgi:hypothetical protein
MPLSRRALRRLDKALFTEDAADQALNCVSAGWRENVILWQSGLRF